LFKAGTAFLNGFAQVVDGGSDDQGIADFFAAVFVEFFSQLFDVLIV